MRPAAATIWKYLLEREQSPEGAPLFMKFYVGCWERGREKKEKKRKEKWVKRRKETTETGRGGKNLERQRLEERSGWEGGVEKEKMPDEKEQKGRKHVRWLSGCRAKNTGRVVSRLNGVSSRGNSIGPIFVLDLLSRSYIYILYYIYIYNEHFEIW